jgi:excisionase family DNA binding protein
MYQPALPKLLLTIDETARMLSMSRSSVYRLILSGQLVSLKIGGKRRVSVQTLHSYIAQAEGVCQDEATMKAPSPSVLMAVGKRA